MFVIILSFSPHGSWVLVLAPVFILDVSNEGYSVAGVMGQGKIVMASAPFPVLMSPSGDPEVVM